MSDFLERLRAHVHERAIRPGRVDSALEGLYYYRADRPAGPMLVGTAGVVIAVIVQHAKTIELPNGQSLHYTPGSYLFVTREARYTSLIAHASPHEPYLSFGLALDPEVVADTLLRIEDQPPKEPTVVDPDAWVGAIDDAMGDCLVRLLESIDDPTEREVLAPLHIRELVFRLLRTEHAGPLRRAARTEDPRIRAAIRYVRENAAEPLTVEALARQVAMSASHFAHRFRAVARVSPMRFVKNVRLREARLRMLRDGLGATEAALEVGYSSPSHFTRDFKSQYGAPPAAYARELRERLG